MAASSAPPGPPAPHADSEEPDHKPSEESLKDDRRQADGVQAEAAAATPVIAAEQGGAVEGAGGIGLPDAGAGSSLRHRRTQVDSELRSEERETSVFPTNSSSKYSFIALEQRKEELLQKAKRYKVEVCGRIGIMCACGSFTKSSFTPKYVYNGLKE